VVVDADAHIIEPPDLWTTRLPRHLAEAGPVVQDHPTLGHPFWRIGDTWLWPVGHWAQAGSPDYPPVQPRSLEEVDPAGYDPKARLKRMNEYGIDVAIIYPNIVGFQAPLLASLGGELALLCIKAYNDFIYEWASTDSRRLATIAMLPYWDLEESVRELTRCVEVGHRGVLFANKFEKIGLPNFCDPYWDPVYAVAEASDTPVNFHVGFGIPELAEYLMPDPITRRRLGGPEARVHRTLTTAQQNVRNGDEIAQIIMSGVCERFPRLKMVSVESAFGYLPFYLENLDWAWKTGGAVSAGELLPSEYFRRQCYGTLWFETSTLSLLEQYPDNFMFSTDFPHPTSLSPGPASPAELPAEHIRKYYGELGERVRSKVLGENALSIYKIDPPRSSAL
jgi:predicted TIM-barrel fold metal-dependent hydrolase